MSRLPLVECRICKKKIDRNIEIEGIDWCKPTEKRYYHVSCYKEWVSKDDVNTIATPGLYYEATIEYLTRELKIPINWPKFENQWARYLKQQKSAKGIYCALRYFYDIKHGDFHKAEGGIGIVSYIYNDSCEYWCKRAEVEKDINEKILEQVKMLAGRNKVVVNRTKKKKKKGIIGLKAVELEEDE